MKNKTWKTADLGLATTISLFYPIKDIDRTNPGKVHFLFEHNKKLNNLIEDYWQGKIKVEPATYFSQLRNVKARLYDK